MLQIVTPLFKIADGKLRRIDPCRLFLPLAERTRLGGGFVLALSPAKTRGGYVLSEFVDGKRLAGRLLPS
jgi:hypothetical protein